MLSSQPQQAITGITVHCLQIAQRNLDSGVQYVPCAVIIASRVAKSNGFGIELTGPRACALSSRTSAWMAAAHEIFSVVV